MIRKIVKKINKNIKPISVILLVILAFSVYWYWQKNVYSKDILKLEILGPDSVDFAKNFDYTIKYKNNGDVLLENARLTFEYPEHSIIADGKPLRQEITLGDIYPGEEKTISFPARLVGQEGQVLTAKASLNYQPKNLKARYESSTALATQIESLPLTFEFDLPSSIGSGKDLNLKLNYFSNIDYPLLNLRVSADYPAGFEFVAAKPASLEKIDWDIPPLNKATGGRIEIKGKIQGNVGEQKLFHAKIGIWQAGEFILLKEVSRAIEIQEPAIRITQKINGNSDYVASPGDQLHYEIFFQNIGQDTLNNLSLMDTLFGDIFDLQTLKTTDGKFTLGDNSIVWDWKNTPALQFLEPQEESKVEFWINLKSDFEIPSLDGSLSILNNVYLGQAKEEFQTKVNSKLEIVQKGFFYDEIFGNTGAIPPRVGQTTTYTISWQAKDYYNSVKNVKVEAVLPPYVSLTGKIFPEDSRLTLDSLSQEIVWEVGDMSVGQGVLNSAPNVSFQVAFTPQSYQVGQTPDIISQTKITGEDSWTNAIIFGTATSTNTTLPDDPGINQQGVVQ